MPEKPDFLTFAVAPIFDQLEGCPKIQQHLYGFVGDKVMPLG